MRRTTTVFGAVLIGALLLPGAAIAAPAASREAVIVVFHDSVADPGAAAAALGRQHGFTARYVYRHALRGFAATVSASAADALARNPGVAWVEADGMAYPVETQSDATWGLDRIDQRDLPLDDTYTYDATGSGVNAYVIDSGINYSHEQFSGRAQLGYDFVAENDLGGADCNGHGTHVAGTIGGETYGVAKDVNLYSVRVFDCTGGSSWSRIIAAVDWVTVNHKKPAVANMSLSGGATSSVDEAVANSIAAGVSYAIAAGNGNMVGIAQDACKYSPARVPEAMTISATDINDRKASFANYGSCVDWFAPGVSITSAWHGSSTATNTISGTSMAAPHTAGVAALHLQKVPGASPAAVRTALYDATTKGKVTSAKTTDNHLLYNVTTATSPPAASFPIHVGDLDASRSGGGNTWSATVAITVHGEGEALIDGAEVNGTWSTGGTATCTTDASGACAVTKSNRKNVGSVTFSVTGVTKSDTTYASGDNHDADGDSNGTSITVVKP